MRYDMAVIGSGAAGFAAAIAARNAGAAVVMIERDQVGGTCVNTGCIPSKALLAAARARHVAARQSFPGVRSNAGPVDLAALERGTRDLVTEMRAAKYTDLAAGYGWSIIAGTARFAGGADDPRIVVTRADGTGSTIEAGHYLVATGSAPRIPSIDGLERAGYHTSTTAMKLTEPPESMLVVGGNAVGLELGQLFARLGARVTIIEARDRLAPFEEPEVSNAIEGVLADESVDVITGADITRVRRDGTGRRVVLLSTKHGERMVACARILVAAGRHPVTAGLDLPAVDVDTGPGGAIVVDARQRTTNPRIWAAGDVTDGPPFVYTAAAQGNAAVANALTSARRVVDYAGLPRVTFTDPAIASVGLTEAELVKSGEACECRVLPLDAVPRALVDRDTRGVVKLVAESGSGRVRGVHAVADGAGELITAAGYAIRAQMTVSDLADAWSPYLTMSEALRLTARSFDRDVAMLSCCA